ncbi:MAG: radical SAM protein [Candidatus Bathyarchaeia archaeon]
MKVGRRVCKTILGHSGIQSVDYAINPYLGCEHGCVYCYARFMSKMGHLGEEWGSFVDVKTNALDRLKAEAQRYERGVVLLSSVTDPYQILEKSFELTRGILKILLEYQYPIEILTKSDLVLRDVNILRKFNECEVGLTITTIDDRVRSVFEPKAPSIERRLNALRRLHESGLDTYVFIGPLLPYLSEGGLEDLLDEISMSANRVIIDKLNIKCGNLPDIQKALRMNYPGFQSSLESALSPGSTYYLRLKEKIGNLCKDRGIPFDFCY